MAKTNFKPLSDALAKLTANMTTKRREAEAPEKQELPTAERPPTAVVVQLPLWAEALRCLPNEIVRSALFNARNRKRPRAYIKKTEITVIGDGRITYQGLYAQTGGICPASDANLR